jgi:hypothetical protein
LDKKDKNQFTKISKSEKKQKDKKVAMGSVKKNRIE